MKGKAFCLMLGIAHASSACGADIHWNGGTSDSWNLKENWDPFGSPFSTQRVPGDGDTAYMLSSVSNNVHLYADTAPIDSLIISNGVRLFLNGHRLLVDRGGFAGTAATVIEGPNSVLAVGSASFLAPPSFVTDNLFMSDSASLWMSSGDMIVEGTTTIVGGAEIFYLLNMFEIAGDITFGGNVTIDDSYVEISGSAQVSFFGASVSLRNNATFITNDENYVEIQSGTTLDVLDSSWTTGDTIVHGIMKVRGTSVLSGEFVTIDGGRLEVEPLITLADNIKIRAKNQGQVVPTNNLSISGSSDYLFESGADLVMPGKPLRILAGGSLDFDGSGSTLTAGTVTLSNDSLVNAATLALRNGASGTINGLELDPSLVLGDLAETQVSISEGATLNVAGTVLVGNTAPATMIVANGGTLFKTGSSATSIRSGSLTIEEGGLYVANNGPFLIDTNGAVHVAGEATNGITESGVLSIQQTLTVRGSLAVEANGTLPGDPGGVVRLSSSLLIDGGTVSLSGGSLTADTINVSGGGSFGFSGGRLAVNTFDGDLANEGGTLSPGTTGAGAGVGLIEIMGDYSQLTAGTLEIGIGGTGRGVDYDTVGVVGRASVAGQLQISLLEGFRPQATDEFVILSAAEVTGFFDGVPTGSRIDTLGGQGSFLIEYLAGDGFLGSGQILLSDYLPNLVTDLDHDGDVDGVDFLLVQRTNPALIPQWRVEYGNTSTALANSQSVPEPAGALLWLWGSISLIFTCTTRIRRCALSLDL